MKLFDHNNQTKYKEFHNDYRCGYHGSTKAETYLHCALKSTSLSTSLFSRKLDVFLVLYAPQGVKVCVDKKQFDVGVIMYISSSRIDS